MTIRYKRAVIPHTRNVDLHSHRIKTDGKTLTLTFYEGQPDQNTRVSVQTSGDENTTQKYMEQWLIDCEEHLLEKPHIPEHDTR